MRATAVLVRWQGGWRWVDDDAAPLRIEVCQGHAGDSAEIVKKAQAELSTYSAGQTEITIGYDPADGDPVLGLDFDAADEVMVDGAWREIVVATYAVDDDTGRIVAVPQFGDILDMPDVRIARTLRSIGGLNSGTSHLARPVLSLPPPNNRPS